MRVVIPRELIDVLYFVLVYIIFVLLEWCDIVAFKDALLKNNEKVITSDVMSDLTLIRGQDERLLGFA